VIRHPVIDRLPVELLEDDEGFHHARGVWLILTDKKTVQSLLDMDFRILSAAYLPGLDRVLVEVVEPDDEELSAVRSLLYSVLPDADVIVDYNHAYTYEPEFVAVKPHGDAASLLNDQRRQPSVLLPLPNMPAETVKIGMIDSRIDHRHEALKNTKIIAKSFVAPHVKEPTEHGTAVASILSGQSEGYRGLLPGAEVFAASVFRQDDGIEQSALAISLVRGLDWLAQTGVDVINMSLSGPENAILQAVLEQLDRRGVVIVAAAGNNGPVGQPLYPAAYDFTVAVTAVSDKHLAFSMANRGGHIDLSAPGVNIQHASTQSAYGYSSGTSLAAPFVSAGAALALAHQKPSARNTQQVLNQLFQSAKDLGTPGRDDVYGHGLIQSPK
jgi:subtilisin family serine protease